jgi:hypothetical protein
MKNSFYLFAAALLCYAQISAADDQQCQTVYSTTVSSCAQTLGSLPANLRPGAQKGCVVQAKAAKDACLQVGNTCHTDCEAAFSDASTTCDYNNNTAICGNDQTCIALVLQRQSDCINYATAVLNSCIASCPIVK